MKNKGLIISLVAVFLGVLVVFLGAIIATKNNTTENSKNITVVIVYQDKSEKKIETETNADNLGDLLFEKGLVSQAEHTSGFYTTIDGIRADYTLDKAWWCITKGGEMTTVGANDLKITNGDRFEITHTPA